MMGEALQESTTIIVNHVELLADANVNVDGSNATLSSKLMVGSLSGRAAANMQNVALAIGRSEGLKQRPW